MSLIQLKSKSDLDKIPSNYSSYFNRGLVIKPDSQIGLVSATIQTQPADVVVITEENNKMSLRFGNNPFVHNTINIEITPGVYEPKLLEETIELEISKKQNFLPFKKITKLNGSHLNDQWLDFGTNVRLDTDSSLVIDGGKWEHRQLPPSNDGSLLNVSQYQSGPRLSHIKTYFGDYFVSEPGAARTYNKITETATGIEVQALSFGLNTNPANTPGVGTGRRNVQMPVIVKEYISYGQRPIIFEIPIPSTGSWGSENDRFVGLVSYGDIMDPKSSLIDGRHAVPDHDTSDYGCKVGWHFNAVGEVPGQGTAVAVCLQKKKGLSQKFGDGVVVDERPASLGWDLAVLSDLVPVYYVGLWPGRDKDGNVAQNKCQLSISENPNLSAPILTLETDPKESFFGTKAYPLIPIIYNGVTSDKDERGSTVIIQQCAPEVEAYTHAAILDSECFVSYPSDIQYNPEERFEFNLYTDDDSKVIPAVAAGYIDDIQLLNMQQSCFLYLNSNKDPYRNRLNRFTTVNDLIEGLNSERWQQLHPDTGATLGPIIGMSFFYYDMFNGGEFDASPELNLRDLKLYKDNKNPSFHIQVNNLPIKSFNSNTSAVVPTFAVLPKTAFTVGQSTTYSPAEVVWVDLNNKQELSVNELTVRITEADNILTTDIWGTVEIIVMIKQK